jgi:uncharacterized protein YbjT (DUF2867 family)
MNKISASISKTATANTAASTLKVVVIGGTGLIGSKLIAKLVEHGHEAVAAAPNTGVNTLTGDGLDAALKGAAVVVDVSNSPTLDGAAAQQFFETSTKNLLEAEAKAGVEHHVALSVVGSDRLAASEYIRAKLAQEKLIRQSAMPYTIVHATQFFEFIQAIVDAATEGENVRVAPVLFQPMAADDVASALGKVATGSPLNGDVEVAGPQSFRFDELVRRTLSERKDPRNVLVDPHARYFGAELAERTLLPGDGARIGSTTLAEWQVRQAPRK